MITVERDRATRRADRTALAVAGTVFGGLTAAGVLLGRAGRSVLADDGLIWGSVDPHVGPGTPVAVLLAVAVVLRGPEVAARLPWHRLLAAAHAAAVAWTLALAMIDGWHRGVAGRLATVDEYLTEVPAVGAVGDLLPTFAARIPEWTTHVAGHPPGALLVFVGLDRVGLGGGAAAALACVLVGGLVAVAVPVALRALGDEAAARAAVPFLVLLPGAVWVGASADGLFAGLTATGVALVALASTGRGPAHDAAALGGGLLLGFGLYVSYGLTLVALPVLAVAAVSRRVRPLLVGAVGVAAVVAWFTVNGFWWVDGYRALLPVYSAGTASRRPYGFWVLANLAVLLTVTGPVLVRVLPLAVARWRSRAGRRSPAAALALAAAAAVLAADLSGLSKAETERIWLPFAGWLVAGTALLPAPSRRVWLVAGAVTALAVNTVVLTEW